MDSHAEAITWIVFNESVAEIWGVRSTDMHESGLLECYTAKQS